MTKIEIMIIMEDIEYGKAIGGYLARNAPEFAIRIIGISQTNEGKVKGCRYILVDEAFKDEFQEFKLDKSRIIVFISEPPTEKTADPEMRENRIFKYDSAPVILRELRYICSLNAGAKYHVKNQRPVEYAGFCSGGSGTGKTVVSIGLARDISKRYGKKVLYLNYEDFPSTKAYFIEALDGSRTISDFLYYIFRERSNSCPVLPSSFMFKDRLQVHGFYPEEGSNELKSLSLMELERFLDYLEENEDFEYVFIDFSGAINEESLYLLGKCRIAYLIGDETAVSALKNRTYYEYVKSRGGETMTNKIVNIINKGSNDSAANGSRLRIMEDDGSFYAKSNITQISISGVFGDGIKAIGDRLVKGEMKAEVSFETGGGEIDHLPKQMLKGISNA